MATVPDWSQGDTYLRANAPDLLRLIDKFSPCTLVPNPTPRYFEKLSRYMISQSLPPEAVDSIINQLKAKYGTLTPERIINAEEKELIAVGLNQQKVDYLKHLAHLVHAGDVTPQKFDEMSDQEILKQLSPIKGLGQWTIEMFLLLGMNRTDIVPAADYKFARALQVMYDLPALPKRGQVNKLTESWRPWRSLGVWYLWQYYDELVATKKIKK